MSVMRGFARLASDERGVSAIEYSLLSALIGLGLIASAQQTGSKLGDGFDTVETQLEEADGKGKGKPDKPDKPDKPGKPGKPGKGK